jgi:hypothetical protein
VATRDAEEGGRRERCDRKPRDVVPHAFLRSGASIAEMKFSTTPQNPTGAVVASSPELKLTPPLGRFIFEKLPFFETEDLVTSDRRSPKC